MVEAINSKLNVPVGAVWKLVELKQDVAPKAVLDRNRIGKTDCFWTIVPEQVLGDLTERG